MLVECEGQLVPIEEPIDLAERRLTLHPHTVIYLTEDDETVPDLEGSVSDFMVEAEEQARNEEEIIQAEISQATTNLAFKNLAPYQDPPGINGPFV